MVNLQINENDGYVYMAVHVLIFISVSYIDKRGMKLRDKLMDVIFGCTTMIYW